MTKNDVCGTGGQTRDEQAISEDCALKGILAGTGLNSLGSIEWGQVEDKLKDLAKGQLVKFFTGVGFSKVKSATTLKWGGRLLAAYEVYDMGKTGLMTMGNCYDTEMGGTNWGWTRTAITF